MSLVMNHPKTPNPAVRLKWGSVHCAQRYLRYEVKQTVLINQNNLPILTISQTAVVRIITIWMTRTRKICPVSALRKGRACSTSFRRESNTSTNLLLVKTKKIKSFQIINRLLRRPHKQIVLMLTMLMIYIRWFKIIWRKWMKSKLCSQHFENRNIM